MVDNRSAGFYGVAGAFNFKSGDISGTAAKTSDDRASQGMEYARLDTEEEQTFNNNKYIDNSAQLNATLNSLAMLNVASVINSKLPKYNPASDLKKLLSETDDIIPVISDEDDDENERKRRNKIRFLNKHDDEEEDNEYF